MKTRLIILTLVALLAMGLAASAAASGPPWPAVVIHDTAYCDEWTWPPSGEPFGEWLLVPGTGIEVQQLKNGLVKITCQMYIDFSDPQYMSLQEACIAPGYFKELCRGKGVLMNNDIECGIYWDDEFFPSQSANAVVNQTGNVTLTCLFRVPPEP